MARRRATLFPQSASQDGGPQFGSHWRQSNEIHPTQVAHDAGHCRTRLGAVAHRPGFSGSVAAGREAQTGFIADDKLIDPRQAELQVIDRCICNNACGGTPSLPCCCPQP